MNHIATLPQDDAALKKALNDVNLPNLLMVMTQLSGNESWLTARYQPDPIVTPEGSMFPDDSGGYSDAIANEIRQGAFDILVAHRDSGAGLPAPLSAAELARLMSFSVAEAVPVDLASMLVEEMCLVDRDQQWQKPLADALEKRTSELDFSVIVIGAGMSGICIAAKLKQAGIAFTVLEKNDSVGGTWYENSYPDCGVDTPNHYYSYSFERNPNWSGYFSKRDELHAYFNRCADDFGIREHIQFESEVLSSNYHSDTHRWTVEVKQADGSLQTRSANVLITAVGQLNRPNMPDIDGIDDFAGALFHSARWRHDVDLEGKRIAVIGTGCSAVQLLPKTAAKASHVDVFQRTPHWVSPARDYYRPVEDGLIWALNNIPLYAEWHRARMIFGFGDRNWPAVNADPNWQHGDRSMNELSEGMREALIAYISAELGDRQDLLEQCVPSFPVFGKRLIVDNGWYRTISAPNVDLITTGIKRITAHGIETVDGQVHPADVLILGTGFKSNLFLWPMQVVGRSGTSLQERWGDYPRAFRGITVPDYPNLFCLYGPNTNIVHGGSIIYQVECQVHYVMQCITSMIEDQLLELEVKLEANDRYNEQVQAISETLAWGHPGVNSWYKNSQGKVVNNSPFSLQHFWEVTHDVDLNEYHTRAQ